MAYRVDGHGNPHVNYEPSSLSGLVEADKPGPAETGPMLSGRLTRAKTDRRNDYQQASDRWRTMEDWERDDLIGNLVDLLSQCERHTRERMIWHFLLVDDDYGKRVGDGPGISPGDVAGLEPLPGQVLTELDAKRLANLGGNEPRPLTCPAPTGSVPNRRAAQV
jgi:catalase